jgi:hypothetical protein
MFHRKKARRAASGRGRVLQGHSGRRPFVPRQSRRMMKVPAPTDVGAAHFVPVAGRRSSLGAWFGRYTWRPGAHASLRCLGSWDWIEPDAPGPGGGPPWVRGWRSHQVLRRPPHAAQPPLRPLTRGSLLLHRRARLYSRAGRRTGRASGRSLLRQGGCSKSHQRTDARCEHVILDHLHGTAPQLRRRVDGPSSWAESQGPTPDIGVRRTSTCALRRFCLGLSGRVEHVALWGEPRATRPPNGKWRLSCGTGGGGPRDGRGNQPTLRPYMFLADANIRRRLA